MADEILLSIYCFLMTFLGLFGNGTVLFFSVRYDAINIDQISLILIQNLAFADIMYTICTIFPQMITYFTGGWILGEVYCFISAQLAFVPGSVNALTVLLITSYRLILITNPFFSISRSTAKILSFSTWVVGTSGTIISLAYNSTSKFEKNMGSCMSSVYKHPDGRTTLDIAAGIIILLPLLVIATENAILLVYAVRNAKKMNTSAQKALVMICTLSGVFVVSWVPFVVVTVGKVRNSSILDTIAVHAVFLNAAANPILYSLTNRRFGRYLKEALCKAVCLRSKPMRSVPSTNAIISNTVSTGAASAKQAGTTEL